MAIDFRDPANRWTYTGRSAGPEWAEAITVLLDPTGLRVADLGCGGGVYARAWRALGASAVVGVDSSPEMVSGAAPGPAYVVADATATGLRDASVDVVFARALIHHLHDPGPLVVEAHRILRPGGRLIVQDRTADDVAAPPSREHLRGHFFAAFPRLLAVENARRPDDAAVRAAMSSFADVGSRTLWETRRRHDGPDALAADLRARTGRSILHELDDSELEELVRHVLAVAGPGPLVERDRWTLWHAVRGS